MAKDAKTACRWQYRSGVPSRDLVTVVLAVGDDGARCLWQSLRHVLPRSGTAFDRPDMSEANEILGSQQ